MSRQGSICLFVGLLLLALPAYAAQTVHLTIDASSPRLVGTGLVFQSGDVLLVRAEGAMRNVTTTPFSAGWFDPSGFGQFEGVGQVFGDSPYGILIGTFGSTLEEGFMLGELTTADAEAAWFGQELKLGLNLSTTDQASIEGSFQVHVTRYTGAEVDETTVLIGPESSSPRGTGIVAEAGDEFLVIGQGAITLTSSIPLTRGWFDASGQGVVRRTGQVHPDAPFGCLLGTFSGNLDDSFIVGDVATFAVDASDVGQEFELGLNMSNSDRSNIGGLIYAHVLRIRNAPVSAGDGRTVPGRNAILAMESYPNPFNPRTTVQFELASQQQVRVEIVNLAGERVRTLAQRIFGVGRHELTWDGRDGAGRAQASGVYLLRLETENASESRKLTLVR